MRLLLDECMPKRLKRDLGGHDARTVQKMGWSGLKNGALLRQAAPRFDALITVDQSIQYQQNMTSMTISIVVLISPSNDLEDLRPLLPALQRALDTLQPGQVIRLGF